MAGKQGGGDDPLGGLLGLSGMDTSAFNRPKSLADMKTTIKHSTPVQASARGTPAQRTGSPLGMAPQPTSSPQRPAPAPADAASLDPMAYLDGLLPKSASRTSMGAARSASVSSFSSTGAPLADNSTAPGPIDDLDSLFSGAFSTAPAAAARAPAAAPVFDDPLGFFGASPSPQPSPQLAASSPTPAAASMDDLLGTGDLLGGFAAPAAPTVPAPAAAPAAAAAAASPAQHTLAGLNSFASPPAAPPARASDVMGAGGFGEFLGMDAALHSAPPPAPSQQPAAPAGGRGSPGRRVQTAVPAATPARPSPAPSAAGDALQHTGHQGSVAGVAPASRQAANPWADSPPVPSKPPAQSPARHRAFDYLDQQEGQGRPARAGTGSGSYPTGHGGMAGQGYELTSALGGASARRGEPALSAGEVKQKAAKMLQAGTQWFVRASKNLVKDLQGLQQGSAAAGRHQGQRAAGEGGGAGSTPPYYYDWAAQLARLSPGSRSAALGAMAEEDRLVVQRIIDEAALGDTYLESTYGFSADTLGGPDDRQPPHSREGSQHGSVGSRQDDLQGMPEGLRRPRSSCALDEGRDGDAAFARAGSASNLGAASSPAKPSPAAVPPQTGDEGQPAGPTRVASRSQLREEAPAAMASPAAEPRMAEAGSKPGAEGPAAAAVAEADFLGFAAPPAAPAHTPRPTVRAPAPPLAASSADGDLLGFGSGPAQPAAAPAAPAPAAASTGGMEDLLGFDSGPAPAAQGAAAPSAPRHRDIEDMFTVPKAPARAAAAPSGPAAPAGQPRAGSAARRPAHASGLDSMIDLGAELPAVDATEHASLYDEDHEEVDDPNEPEIRKVLRQRRIQEKHRRMQQQLAEKRAREEAEANEKAGKVELRDTFKPKINAWAAGKKDNIRALLSSLHTVLWEDSGWTPPNMADMVENHKVKRIYMKANLIVHPDKVKQKGGTLEQITVADMVFDVLKVAWGKFEGNS